MKYKTYKTVDLNKAMELILDGDISVKEASSKYNIPIRTLYDKKRDTINEYRKLIE